jgi:hypothetical protein
MRNVFSTHGQRIRFRPDRLLLIPPLLSGFFWITVLTRSQYAFADPLASQFSVLLALSATALLCSIVNYILAQRPRPAVAFLAGNIADVHLWIYGLLYCHSIGATPQPFLHYQRMCL